MPFAFQSNNSDIALLGIVLSAIGGIHVCLSGRSRTIKVLVYLAAASLLTWVIGPILLSTMDGFAVCMLSFVLILLGQIPLCNWARNVATPNGGQLPAVFGGLFIVIGAIAVYRSMLLSEMEELKAQNVISGNDSFVEWKTVEATQFHAFTDAGNRIHLWSIETMHYARMVSSDCQIAQSCAGKVIRTGNASPNSNCHGWVFAGGLASINPDEVETILADNGYQMVEHPVEGDVVVYWADGRNIHTALVRTVDQGRVFVEGKWGFGATYLHLVENSVYGKNWTYFRAGRATNVLNGL